jgi:hypothetical protein
MKVCVVMAKVEELQARSVDKVFDSREKAERYVSKKSMSSLLTLVELTVL